MGMDHAMFEAICCDVETSTDGLNAICIKNGSNRTSFHQYRNSTPETVDRYARAKQIQAELLADEIIEIADNPELGTKSVSKPTGIEITEGDMIEHRRLRVDSRKWLLAKLLPKKYGDKVDVTSGGDKVASAPLMVVCSNTETASILERMAHGEQPATSPSKDS
jgi:hypothetical protein